MTKNIAILSLTILFSTATFAADFVVAKNTKCKVLSEGLDAKTVVNWHGACKNGMADGLGVARYLKGAKVESVFFVTMKA